MKQETQDAIDWLYSTQLFGIKLGLDGMRQLLERCGLSQPSQDCTVIHVAGTNGKGSTSAMIERIARETGLRTGLFTSPHLVSFHERIRVNGQMIGDSQLCQLISTLRQRISTLDPAPTFFELATAIALMYFRAENCEVIILETGMGGRLDATNAVAKDIAVITPIGLDHTQYLGNSLEEVAGEKAGIIQAGTPTISARQEAEVEEILRARSEEKKSKLHIVDKPYGGGLSLKGPHQAENAALAVATIRALGRIDASDEQIAYALSHTEWAGRYERVEILGRKLILDGAHNVHAMRALVDTYRGDKGEEKISCLFAAAMDKDIGGVIELLSPIVGEWVLAPVTSPRISGVEEMGELIGEYSEVGVVKSGSLVEGIERIAVGGEALVCGSLFLVGEVRAMLGGDGGGYRSTVQ